MEGQDYAVEMYIILVLTSAISTHKRLTCDQCLILPCVMMPLLLHRGQLAHVLYLSVVTSCLHTHFNF